MDCADSELTMKRVTATLLSEPVGSAFHCEFPMCRSASRVFFAALCLLSLASHFAAVALDQEAHASSESNGELSVSAGDPEPAPLLKNSDQERCSLKLADSVAPLDIPHGHRPSARRALIGMRGVLLGNAPVANRSMPLLC